MNGQSEEKIEKLIDRMLEGIAEQKLELKVEGQSIVESIEKADFEDIIDYVKKPPNEKIKGIFSDAPVKLGKKKKKPAKTRKQSQQAVAYEHQPKVFSIANVRSRLKLMWYQEFVKPSGEWDFLIILSRIKTIINVEVKTQLDLGKRKEEKKEEKYARADEALNVSLEDASKQCKEHAQYTARVFAPFLGEGWEFVKVAAIIPGDLNREKICDHCDQFIITGKNDEEIQKKVDKIKDHLINEYNAKNEKGDLLRSPLKEKKDDHEALATLTKVLLGLSSLSTDQKLQDAWRLINGPDADHNSLSAGYTKSDELTLNDLTFIKVLNEPNNYNKLLYYNVGQQHILANKLPLVILKGDFGSGNIIFTF